MDDEGLAARLSGRQAIERVWWTLIQRRSDAALSLNLACTLLVVAGVILVSAWLWGKGSSVDFAIYLVALALANLAYRVGASNEASGRLQDLQDLRSELRDVGFEITQPRKGSRPGVRAKSEDWIEARVAEQRQAGASREKLGPFTWSPTRMVGAIQLRQKPTERLTRLTYNGALAERINALVAAEDPEDAVRMLSVVEEHDWTVRTSELSQIGEAMIQSSEWLPLAINFPFKGVPAEELEHDPDLAAQLAEEDCLSTFLDDVYGGVGRD